MKLPTLFSFRAHWLNLPGALLITLLQRTPVVRVATIAEEAVNASPLGQVLRAAVAATASLGALHTLAGATQLAVSAPSPLSATVGVPIPQVGMTVTGAQTVPGSFRVTGPIPPGLSISGLTGAGGTVNVATLLLSGTPTAAGNYPIVIRAYANANLKGDSSSNFTYTVNVTGGANTLPAFTTQPASQTVLLGATVTFTAAASGSPAPAYQWRKDGVNIAGATSATLTLNNVAATAAGAYSVVATNAAGSTPSNTVTLVVSAPTAGAALPAFTAQPAAQTIAAGSTVVLAATVTGATSFQWSHNGLPLPNATSATLILNATTDADAGTYTLAATNSAGTVTSTAAALTVSPVAAKDAGRLINLSILTPLVAGETMTMGTVLGGGGTSGPKPLLARAAGPSLGQLGITAFLPDPTMSLNNTSASPAVTVDTNNDWNGAAALSTAFASVGAFPYSSAVSKDAAIFQTGLPPGNYTVQVSDAGTGAGTVIAELYDATAAGAFTATTPRLVNVSVLKTIGTGASLTVGFYVGGTTAKTVLIRAIGPTLGLAPFGISSAMPDPQLTLFNSSQAVVAANNDWGGGQQIIDTAGRVGAFAIANAASKDAMLLLTLVPGSYTAQVSPVSGTAGGTAIVEVYEVP